MTWPQNYDPLGNWILSTLIAAIPVLTLFFVLVALKARVWVSALCGMLAAVLLAMVVFKMPLPLVAAAAGHGFIFGLLRIAWVIIASIFLYNIAVQTGQFQVMKDSIAGFGESTIPFFSGLEGASSTIELQELRKLLSNAARTASTSVIVLPRLQGKLLLSGHEVNHAASNSMT